MTEPTQTLSRRRMFVGVSTLGAVAATASLLPGIKATVPTPLETKTPPVRGGGYTLSEHVKRYYKTTLV